MQTEPVPPLESVASTVRDVLAPKLEPWGFSYSEVYAGADPELGAQYGVLFEADPLDFDSRYPHVGLPSSYGPDWPGYCVDLWIRLLHDAPRVVVELEGFEDRVFADGDESSLARRVLAWRSDPSDACRALAAMLTTMLESGSRGDR